MNAITVLVLSGLVGRLISVGAGRWHGDECPAVCIPDPFPPLASPVNASLLGESLHYGHVRRGLVHVEEEVVLEGVSIPGRFPGHKITTVMTPSMSVSFPVWLSSWCSCLPGTKPGQENAFSRKFSDSKNIYGGHLGVMAKNLRTGEDVATMPTNGFPQRA